MRKLKLIYLLTITILGGITLVVLPAQAEEAVTPTCASPGDLGKTCEDPLLVCRNVAGNPTCVCRWGFFEVISGGDICVFIRSVNTDTPREGVAYILNYVIVIITALVIMTAMVSIVIGGYIYMTAGGSADRVGIAKKWIMSAILGIIIALSAWIILTAINPNLVS